MEPELKSFASVTAAVAVSLSYCYFLVSRVTAGKPRLLAVLPVLYLFWKLPFSLSTVHLRGITAFFLAWLATFKLLLFAFGQGPLSDPSLSLRRFLALASLPVKTHQRSSDQRPEQNPRRLHALTHLLSALKLALLAALVSFYPERHRYPRGLVVVAYGVHMYIALEFVLRFAAAASGPLLGAGLELESQFAAPYLSSSLQDFWGRRWNVMVARVLHPSVYRPVRSRWGPLAGVLAAFLVSGLMHEAMFYYLTLRGPTGEVTCFFLLQGMATAAEVWAKEALRGRGCTAPRAVAAPLVLAYVWGTALLLFFPPLLRDGVTEELVVGECVATFEAAKTAVRRASAFFFAYSSFASAV